VKISTEITLGAVFAPAVKKKAANACRLGGLVKLS
jgi:hypothetical protein